MCPTVADAGCKSKNPAQVLQVLRQGIDLNERFKRSVNSGNETTYKALRRQNEQYSEEIALPCVRRAVGLLDQQLDEALLRMLMAYAVSRQNSADETVPEALASVFAKHPDAVASGLMSFPLGHAKMLLSAIESGWPAVRRGLDSTLRKDRTARLRALRAEQTKRAQGQEVRDLRMANVAIAAGIAMSANEQTRTRCAMSPCLGVSQAELGLALIAARSSPASLKALAELSRFKLDGGLAEDYSCSALRKGPKLKKWVGVTAPSELRKRCVAEYGAMTRAHTGVFPASEAGLVCRTEVEIVAEHEALLGILRAEHACP
jgi:hypothetical protein